MRSASRLTTAWRFCVLRTPAIWVLFLFAVCFISEAVPASGKTAPGSPPDSAARIRAVESYGKLPLSFEANAGQADRRVKFLSRGSGYTLFLTATEAVFALRTTESSKQDLVSTQDRRGTGKELALPRQISPAGSGSRSSAMVRMKPVGANPDAAISGLEQLPGTSNYFIGNDPKKWHTAVPNYAKVRYHGVYPGVDVVYYGTQRQLEYDFVVAPGADPRAIKLDFVGTVAEAGKGVRRSSLPRIDRNGDLVVRLDSQEVSFHKPTAYQMRSNSPTKDLVEAGYLLHANGQVGIRLSRYDHARSLTIDPVLLVYSSYIGGSAGDNDGAVAVDGSGNAYLAGYTYSSDFPLVNQIPGACQGSCGIGDYYDDVFVTKLNASGTEIIYSSHIGGSNYDQGVAIAVDGSGNAYVTGNTYSSDYPIVNQIPGACEGSCGTGKALDEFVTKINAAGNALVYSSYIGGSAEDSPSGIGLDNSGDVYVAGVAASTDFPIVNQIPGACRGTCGTGVAYNAVLTEINAAGSALVYSSYIGGSGGDYANGIAVDNLGNAYVTGSTASTDFPIVNQIPGACRGTCGTGNAADGFVIKINAAGSAVVYSSYIGGGSIDDGFAVAVDRSGNAYVSGASESTDFPIVNQISGGCRGSCGTGAVFNVTVTKINAEGNALVYSSYLGGSNYEEGLSIAVDGFDSAYLAGSTYSSDFPIVNQIPGACQGGCGMGNGADVFVTKINSFGNALDYSSYIGGSADEYGYGIAADRFGNAYVTGITFSPDFPRVNQIPGACQGTCGSGSAGDGFVTRILNVGPNAR